MRALEIYDKETQAKVLLFATLSDTPSWLSVELLETLTGFERRKINSCLIELHQEIVDMHLPNFYLSYKKKKGYRLIAENIILEDFISLILKKTIEFELISDIYWDTFISIRNFSLTHPISESSVARKLTKIKQFLKKYELNLTRKNFRIYGSETQIRTLYCFFSWKYHDVKEWPFAHIISEQKVKIFVVLIENFFKIKLNQINKKKLEYILANCLLRFKKGHPIKLNNEFQKYLFNNPLFEQFKRQLGKCLKKYSNFEQEFGFIFVLLMTQDVYYLDSEIRKQLVIFHQSQRTPASLYCSSIINYSEKVTSLSSSQKISLINYLLSVHIFYDLFHLFLSGDNKSVNTTQLGVSTLLIKQKIDQLILTLKDEKLIQSDQNTSYLVEKYSNIAAFLFDLDKLKKTITILFLSDLSVFETQSIVQNLQRHYSDLCTLEIHFYEQKNEDYDLIITNNTIISSRLENVKTIFFSKRLQRKNYLKLAELINKQVETTPKRFITKDDKKNTEASKTELWTSD